MSINVTIILFQIQVNNIINHDKLNNYAGIQTKATKFKNMILNWD